LASREINYSSKDGSFHFLLCNLCFFACHHNDNNDAYEWFVIMAIIIGNTGFGLLILVNFKNKNIALVNAVENKKVKYDTLQQSIAVTLIIWFF